MCDGCIYQDADFGEVDYENDVTGSVHVRQHDPFDKMGLEDAEAWNYRSAMIAFGDDAYTDFDTVDDAGVATLALLSAGYGERPSRLYRGMSYMKSELGIGAPVIPERIWSWSANISTAEEFAEYAYAGWYDKEIAAIFIYDGGNEEFVDFAPWTCNITEQEYLSSPNATFKISEIEDFDPDHEDVNDLDGYVYIHVTSA